MVWQLTYPLTIFGEVIAAVVKIIDNKIEKDADTTIEEIIEIY